MIKLYVTEGKGRDPVNFYRNRVRIFLDGDYSYGLWIDEDTLFDFLEVDQKRLYLSGNGEESRNYTISKETALGLISRGVSPYSKKLLLSRIENS